jgi:hypothetical protein
MNEATPSNPPHQITETFIPHPAFQGEYLAEHNPASLELLMEEMENVKKKIKAMDAKEGQAEGMLRALKKLEEEIHNTAPRKGNLKSDRCDAGNGRRKAITWDIAGVDKPTPEPAERKMRKRKVADARLGHVSSDQKDLEVGDRVKIYTHENVWATIRARSRGVQLR